MSLNWPGHASTQIDPYLSLVYSKRPPNRCPYVCVNDTMPQQRVRHLHVSEARIEHNLCEALPPLRDHFQHLKGTLVSPSPRIMGKTHILRQGNQVTARVFVTLHPGQCGIAHLHEGFHFPCAIVRHAEQLHVPHCQTIVSCHSDASTYLSRE